MPFILMDVLPLAMPGSRGTLSFRWDQAPPPENAHLTYSAKDCASTKLYTAENTQMPNIKFALYAMATIADLRLASAEFSPPSSIHAAPTPSHLTDPPTPVQTVSLDPRLSEAVRRDEAPDHDPMRALRPRSSTKRTSRWPS